jgi:hypothetical protein
MPENFSKEYYVSFTRELLAGPPPFLLYVRVQLIFGRPGYSFPASPSNPYSPSLDEVENSAPVSRQLCQIVPISSA